MKNDTAGQTKNKNKEQEEEEEEEEEEERNFMHNFEKSVPFDPGYSKISFSFLSNVDYVMGDYYQLKTIHQKKFKLSQLEKSITEMITKSTAFYIGCQLWGGFLSARFKDSPKEITGNHAFNLKGQELEELDCCIETNFILDFIQAFDKDCKYYLKKPAKISPVIIEILKSYNEFAELNKHFVGVKKTSDIKLPKALGHFKNLTNEQLDSLYDQILKAIESGKIENLLEIGFYKN